MPGLLFVGDLAILPPPPLRPQSCNRAHSPEAEKMPLYLVLTKNFPPPSLSWTLSATTLRKLFPKNFSNPIYTKFLLFIALLRKDFSEKLKNSKTVASVPFSGVSRPTILQSYPSPSEAKIVQSYPLRKFQKLIGVQKV